MRKGLFVWLVCIVIVGFVHGQQHPSLTLTPAGVQDIKSGANAPMFEAALADTRTQIDAVIAAGIDVPIPKDMAGGYTHEQHKRNYKHMHAAGALYQITGEKVYAEFVKNMLTEYAAIYKGLPLHPTERSYATGKIFWQCLNDANWLVYSSQAYDCIYDYLSKKERKTLESELFRPFADFLSVETPQFFNRVHNHSTWGNAAVGMIGLVMDDQELIDRALYGLKLSETDKLAKDNDGGYVYEQGKAKAGFFAQMDFAFSPDGYYTEGPYYQRYAMTPFMLFALSLHNNKPDIKIFEYRDSLLLKAVYALLYQTDAEGQFYPINDAQKGMSTKSLSVVSAVDIAFSITQDPSLLAMAELQGKVLLDQQGFAVAKAIAAGETKPFVKKNIALRDGAEGDEGALGIMRMGEGQDEISVVFKYCAQGLGHGHFDKLSYSMYEGSTEILQDYGAARWVNIDQKAGGRYLPENKTWAKQTIAHNALIVDGVSHFKGKYRNANKKHSDARFFATIAGNLVAAGASDTNAYPGVRMDRTLLLWKSPSMNKPVVIDLMAAWSEEAHDYEMPYQYGAQVLNTSFEPAILTPPQVMGEKHGYQHVYQEATGELDNNNLRFGWFNDRKFYSLTSISEEGDQAIMARAGANDPNFNIRRDAILIHKKTNAKNAFFLSVIEPHGNYDPVSELGTVPFSQIKTITLNSHIDAYSFFSIEEKNGNTWSFIVSNRDHNIATNHELEWEGNTIRWEGPVHMFLQK
ncbi:MAG: heparinase II/III family protein [Bacteroidia bacterium]